MTVKAPPAINMTAPMHGFGPPPMCRDPLYASTAPIVIQPPPLMRTTCSWMDRHGRPTSPPPEYGGRRTDRREK